MCSTSGVLGFWDECHISIVHVNGWVKGQILELIICVCHAKVLLVDDVTELASLLVKDDLDDVTLFKVLCPVLS